MTKNSKKAAPKKKLNARRAKRQPSGVMRASQAGVRAYIGMLRDPCNSTPVRAPYVGTGGGFLLRTRSIIRPASNAVDAAVALQPGMLNGGNDLSVVGDWVSTTGTPLTVSSSFTPSAINTNTYGSRRMLAACIKVHFSGTEMERKGIVMTGIHHERLFAPSGGFLASQSVNAYAGKAQRTVRLGQEPHEVRYLPLAITDQEWFGKNSGGTNNDPSDGSCAVAAVMGAPPGTFFFEVVCVWEARPSTWNDSGLVDNSVPQQPSFSLSNVFNAIGDIVQFATAPHGGPMGVITGMLGNLANASSYARAPRMAQITN